MTHALKRTRSKLLLGFGALLVFSAIFVFAPLLIHAVYRSVTPDALIQGRRAEYARMASEELVLAGTAKQSSEKARYQLYLWFHARGLSIDEGHAGGVFWQRWCDLINYWRDDDGKHFFHSGSASLKTSPLVMNVRRCFASSTFISVFENLTPKILNRSTKVKFRVL